MSLYHTTHKPTEFPKRKFAPNGGSVTVTNATEERALGLGWSDNDPAPDMATFPSEEAEEKTPASKVAVAKKAKASKE
jgi:hypothetical protein